MPKHAWIWLLIFCVWLAPGLGACTGGEDTASPTGGTVARTDASGAASQGGGSAEDIPPDQTPSGYASPSDTSSGDISSDDNSPGKVVTPTAVDDTTSMRVLWRVDTVEPLAGQDTTTLANAPSPGTPLDITSDSITFGELTCKGITFRKTPSTLVAFMNSFAALDTASTDVPSSSSLRDTPSVSLDSPSVSDSHSASDPLSNTAPATTDSAAPSTSIPRATAASPTNAIPLTVPFGLSDGPITVVDSTCAMDGFRKYALLSGGTILLRRTDAYVLLKPIRAY